MDTKHRITSLQAAAMIGVVPSRIPHLVRSGKLKAKRLPIGAPENHGPYGTFRFSEQAIHDYLNRPYAKRGPKGSTRRWFVRYRRMAGRMAEQPPDVFIAGPFDRRGDAEKMRLAHKDALALVSVFVDAKTHVNNGK